MSELDPRERLGDPCPPKTRTDLEWDRVLEALASRCAFALGRDLARRLPFEPTREDVVIALAEAKEATDLFYAGEPLPLGDVPDVGEGVARLRVGGVLGGPELRDLGRMLAAARSLRRFLAQKRERASRLYARCATDPTLDALADEITGAFDADGTLADHASPRLKELRGEQRAARARMKSRLEELMRRYEGIVQDAYVTEREGRWVIPVRSDAHERFPGIVHGTSASGATLFVEPRAVIPMGNRLKVLEGEVTREEIQVYTRLSALLHDALPSIEAAAEALALADVRAATARLADERRLSFPEISDQPVFRLLRARHLLLAEAGVDVVPSDVAIEGGRALVVSGPNAGGKTVALKTLGLSALMLRAGLPIPADSGSVVGVVDVVLSDVGDDQSLSKNLSTFSAHVKNLARILEETRPGALVLLDEIATGTDPREGEALAAGVLDSLVRRGGAVVATTHYEGLKALAASDERFQNASCGFDLRAMSPTFKIAIGVPGSSSALAVARRFGVPETVLERAERFLSREDKSFEELVRRLNDERAALELARAAAEAKAKESEELSARLAAEIERARARTHDDVAREAEQVLRGVRRAREELRAAQAVLRGKKPDPRALREVERSIDRLGGEFAVGGSLEPLVAPGAREPQGRPATEGSLRRGARVYVARLRAEAEVLEVTATGARIAAGALKLTVPLSDLSLVEGAPDRSRAPAKAKEAPPRALEVALQTSENTCDLRGLRADDAVAMASQFLDRSLNDARRVVFLVHGHGTGALRDAIRAELKSSPYVAYFRAGESGEGGDGVTIAWLA